MITLIKTSSWTTNKTESYKVTNNNIYAKITQKKKKKKKRERTKIKTTHQPTIQTITVNLKIFGSIKFRFITIKILLEKQTFNDVVIMIIKRQIEFEQDGNGTLNSGSVSTYGTVGHWIDSS